MGETPSLGAEAIPAPVWTSVVNDYPEKNLAGKEGVTMEVCAIASNRMGVVPDSLLAETPLVGNTFCSLIGYQLKGYALIPIV